MAAGGACFPGHTRLRRIVSRGYLILICLVSLFMLASALDSSRGWMLAGSLSFVLIVVLLTQGIKELFKRKKAPRKVTFAVTIGAAFFFSFAAIGLLGWSIMGFSDLWKREPVRTISVPISDDRIWKWPLYNDPLPFTLEDLGLGSGYSDYSRELTVNRTPLLCVTDARQDSPPDGQDVPALSYQIADVSLPWLYELCFRDYLNQRWDSAFRLCDEPAWEANAVYRVFWEDEPGNTWLVCYDRQILYLTLHGAELSPEQMTVISRKLAAYCD